MTADHGGKPRRGRRHLTGEEHALWKTVTESVAPLRRKKKAVPKVDQTVEPMDLADARPPASPPPRPPARSKPPPPKPAPPLAPLGRRLKQQVARGSSPIDARIDLHGMTQDRAHQALLRFLRGAQADQSRLVLVITGKGARADEHGGRGVLKRQVPLWLALPEFRAYVIGFESAHGSHGGEGALYVRVRRGGRA